ncbi:MAG: hypothetical protein GU346_06555 [Thermocrinis sp.]|jgi:hypothetical protein|nr:hypothetical protein [Thermocrinis sp.]
MRRVLLALVLVGLVFGLDLRYPENNPGGGKGREYGERARREYEGPKGESNPTRTKLMQPLTAPNQKVIGPGGYQFDVPAVMCGQGSVKDEKVFARVVVSDSTFTFSYASDPYSGILDKTFSTNYTYLCAGGMCQNWDDANKRFTSCTRFRVINGQVITQSVDTLDGCVNPRNQGQLPSYFAGPLISELLEYYKSLGKPITTSKINQDTNGVAEYLGGKVENCQGQPKVPPQTKYLNNPYTMNDAALYYYFTCDPATDPTCRAAKKVMEQERSSDIKTCVIERTVGQNVLRSDQRVCTPGQKLFPDGYNSTYSVCYSGDKFFDFSSSFWLECNPDGRGYTLKGWGYWEGAPCGSTDIYPPMPQVSLTFPQTQIPNWVEIGRLSVNKRTSDDLSSGTCVSDVAPMKVWMRNVNGVLEVKVDNAPACNYFKWSSIGGLVGEYVGDCSQYEKDNCKLVNEWWEDANGKRIQVIKDGHPVQQLTGCVEILRDENVKVWTSEWQTAQAPAQNCNWPPKTCKTVGGRTECRQWWKKIREYKCSQTSTSNYKFDALNQKTLGILNTLEWDYRGTGKMRYTVIDTFSQGFSCVGGSGECYSITKTQPMFVCPLNGKQDPSQSSCDENCYQQHQCDPSIASYECPVTKARYQDQATCTSSCKSPAPCNPVYTCPLNGSAFPDYQSCKAGCNNCLEQGWCTDRRVCPSGYTFNPSTGRCETTPICPSGGYWNPSIRQCVAYPTGWQCVIRWASCEVWHYWEDMLWCDPLQGSCPIYSEHFTVPMTCYSNFCSGTRRVDYWFPGLYVQCYVDTSSSYRAYFKYNDFVYSEDSLSLPPCTGGEQWLSLWSWPDWFDVYITVYMEWEPTCSSGYYRSGSMCYSSFFSCPAGSWYDGVVGKCVRNPDVYWDCSFGGTYGDQGTCIANCVRAIPNCCVMQGQCTTDGRIYPAETCASQCYKNEPCNAVYNYVCSLDGRAYSSTSACLSACRTPVQCILQNTNVEKYVCNLNLLEYGDYNTCQQNCISQNCASYQQGSSQGGISQKEMFIGTAGYDPECATGEKYCIIKKRVDGKVHFDTVQCTMSGSFWVCPADGGQVVEECKCGKDLKIGFGYTAGMLEIIYSALKDRTCGP